MKIFKRRISKAGYCNITAEPISDLDPKRISLIKKNLDKSDHGLSSGLVTPAKSKAKSQYNFDASGGTYSTSKSTTDDMGETVDVTLTPSTSESSNRNRITVTMKDIATPPTVGTPGPPPTPSSEKQYNGISTGTNKALSSNVHSSSIQKRLFSSDTVSRESLVSSSSSSSSTSASPSISEPPVQNELADNALKTLRTIEQVPQLHLESRNTLVSSIPDPFLGATPVITNQKHLKTTKSSKSSKSSKSRSATRSGSTGPKPPVGPLPRKQYNLSKSEPKKKLELPTIGNSRPLTTGSSDLDQSFSPEIISVASGITEPSFNEYPRPSRHRRRASQEIWKTLRENFDDSCRQHSIGSPFSYLDSILDALCAAPPTDAQPNHRR